MLQTTTAPSSNATTPEIELPKRVSNAVTKLRKPFAAFVHDMEAVATSRSDLAPMFMKAFHGWRKATSGNFVSFCRLLDPTIPEDRDGYKRHKAYAAADYLRRVASGSPHRRQEQRKGTDAPVTPLDAVARTLAILLPLVPNPERPKLWERITAELHWTDRQIVLLRQRAEAAPPLLEVKTPRGAPNSLVIH